MALFSLSCNKTDGTAKTAESGNGSIAIVDLDKVAKAMGWTDDMTANLKDTDTAISGQLNAAIKPTLSAVDDRRTEIAKAANLSAAQITQLKAAKNKQELEQLPLSAKQVDELMQAFANAYQVASQAQGALQQNLDRQKALIIKKYRETIAPAVRRVAIAEHKSVVIIPDANVMYYEAGADLSDKIIDDLQHSNAGKVELPPIPVLKIQAPPVVAATTRPK
jgi:flagellar motor protein MotB